MSAAPVAPIADARREPAPRELPRVRRARGEPEWSSKPTEMDLPRVGDFVPEHESISTRDPTPRMLPRRPVRDESLSVAASILTAVIALLALAVLLALIVGLARAS